MGDKACNLITQPLRRDDCNFIANALVCLEVKSQARVVFLDNDTRGLLDGLRANATLLSVVKEKTANVAWSRLHAWNKLFEIADAIG